MDSRKIVGTIFGMITAVIKVFAGGTLQIEPIYILEKMIIAVCTAIPAAVVGYIVATLMKSIHSKLEKITKKQVKLWVKKHKKSTLISIIAIIIIATGVILKINNIQNAKTSFVHVTKLQKTNITVGIVYGHGSIYKNTYQTAGKQSPEWACGLKVYEGYSNQLNALDLAYNLRLNNIDVELINQESRDVTLYERVWRANNIFKKDNKLILISLHHNAQPTDNADYTDIEGYKGYTTNGATGIEVYTSIGHTESDVIAQIIIDKLKIAFPATKFRTDRSDGDDDKEANFYILQRTSMPAVLIEWLFMTTYEDCMLIANFEERQKYVQALTDAIIEYNNNLNKN